MSQIRMNSVLVNTIWRLLCMEEKKTDNVKENNKNKLRGKRTRN